MMPESEENYHFLVFKCLKASAALGTRYASSCLSSPATIESMSQLSCTIFGVQAAAPLFAKSTCSVLL
jgi:hypothetical protein